MKRKFTFFTYSAEHSELREIKWFRVKFFGSIVVSVTLALILIMGADYYVFDFFGFRHEREMMLESENQALHQKLNEMTQQIQGVEHSIKKLSSTGDELRLKENLPSLTPEEKEAGIGGTVPLPIDGITSSKLNDLLISASSMIDKLSGEVKVQESSYSEIFKKQQDNQEFFQHFPALKPMDGEYGVNDFGMRKHPVLGIMKFHEGIDIINDIGTPVYAPADGTIEFAGHSGGGYSIIMIVKHGYGYETLYGHLSKTIAKEGQKVKRGDLIARSGNTGLVSGPHLHYEVHLNGIRQNPIDYFMDDVRASDFRKQVATR